MKPRDFLKHIDSPSLMAAIARAEARTTGEIRVFISRRTCDDPLLAARKHFHALGMVGTQHRNAVLIFIAPASHAFALYGDTAIHLQAGGEFFTRLRDDMQPLLKKARYHEALLLAVDRVGNRLAQLFPAADQNPDELPNDIAHD